MKLYLAPLEGLTGYIYRNAYHAYFGQVDKYFAPFIIAGQKDEFKARDLNDILPEHNKDIYLVPQLLTNQAQDFIFTSKKLQQFGYREINLNLGCPSGTVVSKNQGSGFLARTEELDRFLYEIFEASVTEISVKTRIGKDSPEEFYELIKIFNKYPIKELIIHPRIQKDYYKNQPNLNIFQESLPMSKNPVGYNGDIFSTEDFNVFHSRFPEVSTVMLGRGILKNPNLSGDIRSSLQFGSNEKTALSDADRMQQKIKLKKFHDQIYNEYKQVLSGDKNVLYKMKELWSYLIESFEDSTRYAKKIKKAERCFEYDEAVSGLFREC